MSDQTIEQRLDKQPPTKLIKLTNREVYATVDVEDYEELNKYSWFLSRGYAMRSAWLKETKSLKTVSMHATINNTPKGLLTDHINRDKLDNRRCNLRTVTASQNGLNRKLNVDNNSGYTGVYFEARSGRWCARIKANKVQKHLGTFDTLTEAVVCRMKFEHELALNEARIDENTISRDRFKEGWEKESFESRIAQLTPKENNQ